MRIFNSCNSNLLWIIGIATFIIICLISYICTCRITSSDIVLCILSFASALLSIVLSSFAIFYTHTSNVQIQQQFDKINDAANNINNTAQQLMLIREDIKATRRTMDEVHSIMLQQNKGQTTRNPQDI